MVEENSEITHLFSYIISSVYHKINILAFNELKRTWQPVTG